MTADARALAPDFNAWLLKIVDAARVSRQRNYVAIYTDDFEASPLAALELGIAVILDKPIYLIAPKGKAVPMNVRALAKKIERYDPEIGPAALEVATAALLKRFEEEVAHAH